MDRRTKRGDGRDADPLKKLVIADQARADLLDIWAWNAAKRSRDHAERYLRFLRAESERLARSPSLGRPVDERPGLRYITVRKRKGGFGHVLVYGESEDTVDVLHVFHTAQDWRNKLEDL